MQVPWTRVAITPNKKNKGAREDLRFRCSALTDTHVRCRASACAPMRLQVPLHQFAFFITLDRELTDKAWRKWRRECRAAKVDVDHEKQRWWRAVRCELTLKPVKVNRQTR